MNIIDTSGTGPLEVFTDQQIGYVMDSITSKADIIETLCSEMLGHMSTDQEDWKDSIMICENLMLTTMRSAQKIRWMADRYSEGLKNPTAD